MTVGCRTDAPEELPLTLQTRDTLIEMPGVADALGVDADGGRGFAARVVFDGKIRLPSRLIYWGADRAVVTGTLLDRKTTGGVKLPYRIVTAAGDRIDDEMSFDQVVVNARPGKGDFAR
jgi:hypothetical protein